MRTLFSASWRSQRSYFRGVHYQGLNILLTARFPKAALAARCTSISGLWRRNRIGSRVSRSTSRTSDDLSADWCILETSYPIKEHNPENPGREALVASKQ